MQIHKIMRTLQKAYLIRINPLNKDFFVFRNFFIFPEINVSI